MPGRAWIIQREELMAAYENGKNSFYTSFVNYRPRHWRQASVTICPYNIETFQIAWFSGFFMQASAYATSQLHKSIKMLEMQQSVIDELKQLKPIDNPNSVH